MDVEALMKLERPLTDEEMTVMEERLLELTQQLGSEVARITKDLDPKDPEVAKLLASTHRLTTNVKAAIECRDEEVAHESRRNRRRRLRSGIGPQHEPVYTWERLPVYAWCNEFARVVGRLLADLPKRNHLQVHLLAGQASLISNCIALGHRDCPPGEVTPLEELRAYRRIGHHATFMVMEMLEDLASTTKSARADIAQGMSLIGQIRSHFETALAEQDEAPPKAASLVH